ncbi:uncharacterized protein LOC125506827 [Triticum urartu]|uniref:uncharacterized protein LOC125506827 n=1 Tax=Triticum urartu TaxID=4572 RepID=UPI0020435F3F|nr:uncharacterized protein LOC125506827 [Triticum urartu]
MGAFDPVIPARPRLDHAAASARPWLHRAAAARLHLHRAAAAGPRLHRAAVETLVHCAPHPSSSNGATATGPSSPALAVRLPWAAPPPAPSYASAAAGHHQRGHHLPLCPTPRLFHECLCWLCRCFSCAGIFSSPRGALSVPLPLPSLFDYRLYGLGDFYRCEDGKLEEARAVVNKHCPKLVHNLMHEARPLAVRKYMATQGYKSLDKKAGRRLRLEKDKYMEVTPRWCVDKGECWERIVDYWCSKEYRAKNKDYRNRRAAMLDPPHHQGNLNVMEFGERWASHHNAPLPNLFVSYALAHKAPYRTATPYDENDTASAYSSKTAYDRMEKFKGMAKELKGCHILTSPCIRVLHHV